MYRTPSGKTREEMIFRAKPITQTAFRLESYYFPGYFLVVEGESVWLSNKTDIHSFEMTDSAGVRVNFESPASNPGSTTTTIQESTQMSTTRPSSSSDLIEVVTTAAATENRDAEENLSNQTSTSLTLTASSTQIVESSSTAPTVSSTIHAVTQDASFPLSTETIEPKATSTPIAPESSSTDLPEASQIKPQATSTPITPESSSTDLPETSQIKHQATSTPIAPESSSTDLPETRQSVSTSPISAGPSSDFSISKVYSSARILDSIDTIVVSTQPVTLSSEIYSKTKISDAISTQSTTFSSETHTSINIIETVAPTQTPTSSSDSAASTPKTEQPQIQTGLVIGISLTGIGKHLYFSNSFIRSSSRRVRVWYYQISKTHCSYSKQSWRLRRR